MKSFKFLERSPFNYWSINLIWPKAKWGKVTFSEDYDASIDEANKYSLAFPTEIGYYEDNHFNSGWVILIGFGLSVNCQNGY